MNAAIAPKLPPSQGIPGRTVAFLFLALLFAILLGWTARMVLSIEPVPIVPCRSCGQKCSCPKLSGAIRCGCPE